MTLSVRLVLSILYIHCFVTTKLIKSVILGIYVHVQYFKALKTRKAAGFEEIRFEVLSALKVENILFVTGVCQGVWSSRNTAKV